MSLLDQFSKKKSDPEPDNSKPSSTKKAVKVSKNTKDLKKPLHELATSRYLNYAMSVITSRALPDVRDGLKPVQRRILYVMHEELRLTYNKKHRKSAAVVGSTLAKFHPHGDCLRGNTKVYLANGQIKTIQQLENEGRSQEVWCVDPEGNPVIGTAHSFRIGQHTDKIYRLKLSNGRQLEVTGNHPLYSSTKDWVKAEDVTEGFLLYSAELTNAHENPEDKRPTLTVRFAPNSSPVEMHHLAASPKGVTGEVVHHKNHNPWDNRQSNLEYLSRSAHAKHHQDYERGLEMGRRSMFGRYGENREATKAKNSYLMSEYNSNQGVFKAVKLIHDLEDSGMDLTLKNYEDSRMSGDYYNYPIFERMIKRGQIRDFSHLLEIAKERRETGFINFDPDIAYQGVNISKIRTTIPKVAPTKPMREESQKKRIFQVFSKIIESGRGITRNSYDQFRKRLIQETGMGYGNIHGRNYLKSSTIEDSMGFDSLIDEFRKRVPFVAEVEILEVDQEPMYDFTVDGYENMFVVVGKRSKYDYILAPVHNSACYEAMVRMAQPWAMRLPLVDGHGNFGSVDGDNAAAHRYTEARLQPVMTDLMQDIRKEAVSFRPNFDNTTTEPEVLPFSLPLLLINGATGIAVGMATNIPPHNIGNVCDAAIDLLRNPARRDATLVRNHLIGPDFPTGGNIVESPEEIEEIYATGKGTVTIRSKWHTEKKGRTTYLVITEIPYAVAKQTLVEKIAGHIVDEKIPQIVDIRDESTKEIRVVLELKKGANVDAVMAYLLKYTPLQSGFHVNMTCLIPDHNNEGRVIPKRLSLKEMLQEFLDFRVSVITRRLEYELGGLKERVHILDGFITVLSDAQKAVDLVMVSKSKGEASTLLMDHFKIDEDQANHVLDTKIYRLASYEIEGVKEELKEKKARAKEIEDLLADEEALKQVLIDELKSLKKEYDDGRRTTIEEDLRTFEYDESLYIEEVDVHCVLSRQGWIRRQKSYTDLSTLRVRDNDELGWVLSASTRDVALFFTNKGKVYTERVDELPDTTGYGEPIQSLFSFDNGEKVIAAFTQHKTGLTGKEEMVAISTDGSGVRFDVSKYIEPSTSVGRTFMRLEDDQSIVNVEATLPDAADDDDHVVLITRDGRCLSFEPKEIRHVKGVGKGVNTITLSKGDSILAFGMSSGTRGGSLSVETNRGATHDLRHTTHGVGARGQLGTRVLKTGTYVKWLRETVEMK